MGVPHLFNLPSEPNIKRWLSQQVTSSQAVGPYMHNWIEGEVELADGTVHTILMMRITQEWNELSSRTLTLDGRPYGQEEGSPPA